MEPFEEEFLKDTEEVLQDYIEHEVIFETLDICTMRQLGKANYIQKFSGVLECIERKMYQLCESSEQVEGNTGRGTGPSIEIPGVIDTRLIVRAYLRGYKHIKRRLLQIANEEGIVLEKKSNRTEIGIFIVLMILARSNLDKTFQKP